MELYKIFIARREEEQGNYTSFKKCVGYYKVTFLFGIVGVYQAVDPTSADHLIPERLVENSISERAKTIIKLSPGLATWILDKQIHFGACCLVLNTGHIPLCS